MSEQFDLSSLSSKKGFFDADYNEQVWIPCPPIFPAGVDREAYAAGVAQIWLERIPLRRRRPGDEPLLAALLAEIHQATYGNVPCHYAFIHLPDPKQLPLVVHVGVWESRGGKDEALRMLCRADDPQAVEPPIVEECTTSQLGTGLRVMRYCHLSDDGALYAGLSYAWRSEQYETDLVLTTVSEDLGRLQHAIPDIEDLVATISFIPQEETPRWSRS